MGVSGLERGGTVIWGGEGGGGGNIMARNGKNPKADFSRDEQRWDDLKRVR